MRENFKSKTLANVEIKSVLARPGTPIKRQWPPAKRAIKSSSMTPFWPTMTLETSASIFSLASFKRRAASISDFSISISTIFHLFKKMFFLAVSLFVLIIRWKRREARGKWGSKGEVGVSTKNGSRSILYITRMAKTKGLKGPVWGLVFGLVLTLPQIAQAQESPELAAKDSVTQVTLQYLYNAVTHGDSLNFWLFSDSMKGLHSFVGVDGAARYQ